ncbi:L-histidine N(alpha)-methyltransferase [Pedobacter psychrodurus]|uniref:L-histidine N(Alpha)-methyltransferase n=1 Tax=Pedobacter psychrodurus TaxID=2530456 RepID=A0A4R0Q1C0_9SPHI|nr:L-histidine N(alpha)-methyltransferase [Pedobacter psychrodurus]TCD27020.1 L-histidine N(alpha)-methyltransferase [Pedobacter psychrodurus]
MTTTTIETATDNKTQFLQETLAGLHSEPKFMRSKYFYDAIGDRIFQQIMEMEEYYLTNAEMEILQYQANQISQAISADGSAFDLIELGAGDATKSIHLLKSLLHNQLEFSYFPIDISAHVISDLEENLPKKLPGLDMKGLNGDYFNMLKKATELSSRRKVVLFMGANIGNMSIADAGKFCSSLKKLLSPKDLLIIGFDLKKNPQQILSAYNDKGGITRSFNLNLLHRINKELDGNFDLNNFEHYASYDPASGACKSYLISLKKQIVNIGQNAIHFAENEHVFMEISQKYSLNDIDQLAEKTGFKPLQRFFDQHQYFVDAIWKVD